MMRSITNMPIFLRLFLAFVLAAVIPGIVIAVLGSLFINTLSTRGQAMQNANDATKLATDSLSDLQQMQLALVAYHSTVYANQNTSIGSSGDMRREVGILNTQILDLEHNFTSDATQYQQQYQLATSPTMDSVRKILQNDNPGLISDQQSTLQTILNQQWPDYKQAQDREVTALQEPNVPHSQAHSLLQVAQSKSIPLIASWQHIVTLTEAINDDIANIGGSQIGSIMLGTVIALLGTAMAVITIGFIVNLTITRPLRELASLTKRISKGDTSARAKIPGRDEIHIVATSMNNMLDNIVRLIQETQGQRDVLQAQVEKLVSEVSGVGEGDLRIQAEVSADALGVLADSFNYMVEELGNLVIRVKMVAHEVENSTGMIIDRMTQLVEDGDIQIQQIDEAAHEVERMADSGRHMAERAQLLYAVAAEARQNAQGGREAVDQAIEGMNRIHTNVQTTSEKVHLLGERSREINNIVEAISSIAHQTNRLALDAAIQAAMAGENGKGFGAVAADIRRLAERAKEQAGMITRIVRSVREDIGAVAVSMQDTERETSTGTKLTQEAGTALEQLFSVVEHQAREIEGINQIASQQLHSSRSVVQIMQSVSSSTQSSGTSTREASQYMERLARLVEQLRSSVEAFKLQEEQDYLASSAFPGQLPPTEEQENQLSLSGAFRTVTATAQPTGIGMYNALPPARSTTASDPFATYATPTGQQNTGGWNMPPQSEGTWSTPPQGEHPWNTSPQQQDSGWNMPPYPQQTGGNGSTPPYPPQFPAEQRQQYDEWANGRNNR
ncbi:MAG: methyl-accepting chemotaxis protein [Chloroflexota bacterium]|nr:methyl-accepting chemotaxis protein [Chloroflexota bacterium]